jgi:phage shock protein A
VARLAVAWATWTSELAEPDPPDPAFNAMTSRLLRREALRRAAGELNTMTGPGLEQALARISAEVTEEAACRRVKANGKHAAPVPKPPAQV